MSIEFSKSAQGYHYLMSGGYGPVVTLLHNADETETVENVIEGARGALSRTLKNGGGLWFLTEHLKNKNRIEYRVVNKDGPEGTYLSIGLSPTCSSNQKKPLSAANFTLEQSSSVGWTWGMTFYASIRKGDPTKTDHTSLTSFQFETMYNCCGLMVVHNLPDVVVDTTWEWIRLLAKATGYHQVYYTGPVDYPRNPPGIKPVATYPGRSGKTLGHFAVSTEHSFIKKPEAEVSEGTSSTTPVER